MPCIISGIDFLNCDNYHKRYRGYGVSVVLDDFPKKSTRGHRVVFPKIIVITILAFMIALVCTGIAVALDWPHNAGSSITCYTCHMIHNSLGPSLTNHDEINNLCDSCHIGGGPGSDALTHQGLSCTVCHNPHTQDQNNIYGSTYGKLIRTQVETTYSGVRNVIFTSSTSSNSFADGDTVYDGICEVCHINTHYHTYNGTYDNGVDPGPVPVLEHHAGENCLACHMHTSGIGGQSGSHSIHIESGGRGPNIGCDGCHESGKIPKLLDGLTFQNTTVCDTCHSDGGAYDGVNHSNIGAKINWANGVYSDNVLISGKEKWCAGCHDDDPSTISGVDAPMVVGDESGDSNYGIGAGYGFYKTGHGLASNQTYPSSGGTLDGAALSCEDCHDVTMAHIDGVARTHISTANIGTANDYQHGYRLKSVNDSVPMVIPRTDTAVEAEDFRLCLGCHAPGPFTSSNDLSTNFRNDDTGPLNSHYYHLAITGPPTLYNSDWRVLPTIKSSKASCVTCHNVHGSRQLAMVRDGDLVGGDGLRVVHYASNVSYACTGPLPHYYPTPADTAVLDSTGTVWYPQQNLCSGCHNEPCRIYMRTPVGVSADDYAPPSVSNQNPSNGAVNIAVDSDLTFALSDNVSGVDWTTFSIQLSGDKGYSVAYTDADTQVSEVSTVAGYDVTVNPDDDFGTGEIITVTVQVDDLANPVNHMTSSWSFTTIAGAGYETLILHPSGVVSDSGGYFSVWPIGGPWSDVLDSNDGDNSYVVGSTGWMQVFTVDMAPPGALGAIESIRIHVYARYLTGPWPSAVPVSQSLNIGYTTDGAIVYDGVVFTDDSGDYNHIMSSIYNTDSGGNPLELIDIENLEIAVRRETTAGGAYQLRVTEAYAEIVYSTP